MNLTNHEKKFCIIQFEGKNVIFLPNYPVYMTGWIASFDFYWNSEYEMQTFRMKLVQNYTVMSTCNKAANVRAQHTSWLSHPLPTPQKSAKSKSHCLVQK